MSGFVINFDQSVVGAFLPSAAFFTAPAVPQIPLGNDLLYLVPSYDLVPAARAPGTTLQIWWG